MGGFSAQVQQPQTGQPAGGKMGHLADQAAKSAGQQMTPEQQMDASTASYNAPGGPGAALNRNQNQAFGSTQNSPLNQFGQPTNGQLYTPPAGGWAGHLADQVDKSAEQPMSAPMGKGGRQTNSATSGQPRAGAPNQYSNTVGQWDNAQIQQPQSGGGKGKG